MDLTNLLEGAKKSKKALRSLKLAALDAGQFELAAKLRDLERELFPDTEDEIYAKNINLALRMSGVNPDLRQSWLIGKTMEAYRKSKGKFSIDQASDLIAKADKIFEV
ncbi:MAG: UvrB/UvrC motif-containing protein [Bacteroidia bacterium]|nr:UvrB/UvrC motif-containing protein [Bacteroidia bacterium]